MFREIPERDWKLLKHLKPRLLDRFWETVLVEVAKIAKDSKHSSHERYLELFRYTREQDRIIASAFNGHRRSTALSKLSTIHSLGLLTDE